MKLNNDPLHGTVCSKHFSAVIFSSIRGDHRQTNVHSGILIDLYPVISFQ